MKVDDYPKRLREAYEKQYAIAVRARSKGLDVSLRVESESTYDLAERVEKSVGPRGVAERIRELNKVISREETALKISEDIVLGRFGSMGEQAAAEQAVRTALAVLDEAVTVAPIQGIHSVKIRTNPDRTRHLALYFAGPMRSAGGTEMGLILIVGDHVRRQLGLQPYKATDQEARRFVEELRTYERHVNRFQYRNPDKLVYDTIARLPVEPNGVETDQAEVAVNRNLSRVETNRVRGGALRVVNDGLLGRSQKILRIVDRLRLEGWEWLSTLKAPVTEGEEAREFMFMEDVVGGRPIFAFPGAAGGFRIRYGRSRNTGLASIGIHPSTMEVLGGFLAVGVQMRLERPGKAGIVTAVDTIEPPVVKLRDGSVVRVETPEVAKELKNEIERVLFLGDLLIAYGEFLENNRALVPSGFVEEWWSQILWSALESNPAILPDGLSLDRLWELAKNPFSSRPSVQEAIQISRLFLIPLHPHYSYFWNAISLDELKNLKTVATHRAALSGGLQLNLPQENGLKLVLEKLCVPHRLDGINIVLSDEASTILRTVLAIEDDHNVNPAQVSEDVQSQLSVWAGFPVKSKTSTYVGARMGRPEKAKERTMTPKVHVLFPSGQSGGPRRDVIEASKKTITSLDIVNRICPNCERWEPRQICPQCGTPTKSTNVCPRCGRSTDGECPSCGIETVGYSNRSIDLRQIVQDASKKTGMVSPPESVKGVKGLTNKTKTPEPLEKGFLRARHDVSIFKDGTLRFDAVNAVLTHFRPVEIGLSLERAHALGYENDVDGNPLASPEQLCALQVQDIVVPETCASYLVKVASFIDDLLQSYYGIEKFYIVSAPGDLIGQLIVGLSPHTSVGMIGRIIGFTRASVCYAHPLWHAAKRRDCDGDEDSVSLLLDILLNFSREYLPDRIGGLMDAPLLLSPLLNPNEVARQALNIETLDHFPILFFEKTQEMTGPKEVEKEVLTLGKRMESGHRDLRIGFTHPTARLDRATLVSAYKELPTMLDKVKAQLDLADQIVAVKGDEVARKVLSTHILRDLVGNLRTYTSQRARCSKCNSKARRVPLEGKCSRCGGKLGPTVFKNGVEKYLSVASEMVRRYDVGEYYRQRLDLIKLELSETFKPEDPQQQKLFIADYA